MYLTRTAQETATDAVQVFGGRGITRTGMGSQIEHVTHFPSVSPTIAYWSHSIIVWFLSILFWVEVSVEFVRAAWSGNVADVCIPQRRMSLEISVSGKPCVVCRRTRGCNTEGPELRLSCSSTSFKYSISIAKLSKETNTAGVRHVSGKYTALVDFGFNRCPRQLWGLQPETNWIYWSAQYECSRARDMSVAWQERREQKKLLQRSIFTGLHPGVGRLCFAT
jgi:hypothetical protein